jgi:hypothetical protein
MKSSLPFNLRKLSNKLSITKEEENVLEEIYKEYYDRSSEINYINYQKEFPLKDYYEKYLSSHKKQEYSLYIFSNPIITQSNFDEFYEIGINNSVDALSPYVYNDFMNTLVSIRKNNKPNTNNLPYIKYPIFFSGKTDSYVAQVIDRLNNLIIDLKNIDKKLTKLKIILKQLTKNNYTLKKEINNLSDKEYKSIFNNLRRINKKIINGNLSINNHLSINKLQLKLNTDINKSFVSIANLISINNLHKLFNKFDNSYIIKLRSLLKNIKNIIQHNNRSLNNIYKNKSGVSYRLILKYFERLIGQKLNKSIQLSNFNELSKLENKLINTKKNMNKNLVGIIKKQQKRSTLIHNIKKLSGENYNKKKREIKIITITINQLKEIFQTVQYNLKKIKINNIVKRLIRLREKLGLPYILENSELPEKYKFEETNNNKYVSTLSSINVNQKENTMKSVNQIGYLLLYEGLFKEIYDKLNDEDIGQILSIKSISDKYKYLVLKKNLDESIYKHIKHKLLDKKGYKSLFKKIVSTSPNNYKEKKNLLQYGGFLGLEISLLSATTIIAIVMISMNIFYKVSSAYIKYLYNKCSDKTITSLKSIKIYVSSEFRYYLIVFLLFMIEFMVGSIFFFIPHFLVICILKYYSDFIVFIYKKQTNKSKSKIYRIFESIYLSCGPYYYRYLNSKEYKNEQLLLKDVPYSKQIKMSINTEYKTFKNTIHCIIQKKRSSENKMILNNFDKNKQQIYQLIYDLGFLDDNEIIKNIKRNLLKEMEEIVLKDKSQSNKINWSNAIKNQISLLGTSISEDEKKSYIEIDLSPNQELIKLLPLFKYIFFIQLLDPNGNYTDKKIYGIIVIDRLFANEVFIKYNNNMEKNKNLHKISDGNNSDILNKFKKIMEQCKSINNTNNTNNTKSYLNFLLSYFGLAKK